MRYACRWGAAQIDAVSFKGEMVKTWLAFLPGNDENVSNSYSPAANNSNFIIVMEREAAKHAASFYFAIYYLSFTIYHSLFTRLAFKPGIK